MKVCKCESNSGCCCCSLEDAEAAMKHRRMQAEKPDPVSAVMQFSKPKDESRGANDEEPDSDEEWKNVKASDAARVNVFAKGRPLAKQRTIQDDDEDVLNQRYQESALNFKDEYKPSDAEDWEHEIAADDDDLDMGDGSDDDGSDGIGQVRNRGPSPSVSGDEGEMSSDGEGLGDRSVRQRMKRVLRNTGLESGSSDEEEDDDDVDALDRMASAELPMQSMRKVQESDNIEEKKRKSPESPDTSEGTAQVQAKKQKQREEEPAGIPTEEEIKQLLTSRGRLQLSEIANEFRSRLHSSQDKKQFTKNVKAVAKFDPKADPSGPKYLICK